MTKRFEALFRAARAACTPAQWSRGVELNRAQAVRLDRVEEDAAVFVIAARGAIGRNVTLFPEDPDWDCGCTREGACEHVAAAVIAWRRAEQADRPLEETACAAGRVGYRLRRGPDGLVLSRVAVTGEGEKPLETRLASRAANPRPGDTLVFAQVDLAVELMLGGQPRFLPARPLVPKLLARLARCSDVQLDGEPVEISTDPLVPRIRLADRDDGFLLQLVEDEQETERFPNGMALRGRTLHPLGEPALTARELQDLTRGRCFGVDDLGELLTEILPTLERRLPVEIATERLPSTKREPLRVRIETSVDGERLSVLPTLVYGEPPCARIDAGRLVHLQGAVPLRDVSQERRLVSHLRSELALTPGIREEFVGEAAVAFASRLEAWDDGSERTSLDSFRLHSTLQPSFDPTPDRFAVRFESLVGGEGSPREADPARVLRAWRSEESLVPLLGGGWAPLPRDWLERHGERLADLLAARDEAGTLPTCALPDLAVLCDDLDLPPPPGFETLRLLLQDFAGIPEATLPDDLTATPRNYQSEGISWLVFLREAGLGALLADDMGLGKTLQALCAIKGRSLVICPTSVLHNWADEARRFRPGLRVRVYHGAQRTLDPNVDVTLTTYALLRLDADKLAEPSWDTVVLDEAQAIKNPDSQVAGAAYRLKAGFRMALTGTPVENRLEELWSQFHFTDRGLLGGRHDFQERYAGPISRGDAVVTARLRERIRPFLLRRLKREVAPELPPRTDVVLRCELSTEERSVYDTIRAATLREVVQKLGGGASVIAVLEALLRLRQAACHSALVPGNVAGRSSKLDLLLESLESVVAEGHKALVFSQWTSLLDLAEPTLRAAGLPFTRLDGATRDRAGVVRGFQSPGGPPILLVSLKAGGVGLNLTAADHIFLLDPWWNPAVEDQAADRAHRIGQERPVMVYRLVAEETVEERILELQQRKREVADAALGQADRATAITREELLELLH